MINYLITEILPTLKSEVSNPQAAGYDMSESFLTTIREFVLAEAQECFWQQAVLRELRLVWRGHRLTAHRGIVQERIDCQVVDEGLRVLRERTAGRKWHGLSISIVLLTRELRHRIRQLTAQNWISHMTVKKMHFEAAAQYRLSQEDLAKNRYGSEIARLRVAEGLAKKGLDAGRKGVSDHVVDDLKVSLMLCVANMAEAGGDSKV